MYKAIIEEEAAKSQKRTGQFGNQYGVPQNQASPAPSVTPQQPNADLNPSYRVDELPRTSPTLQSQSFKRLQHILGDGKLDNSRGSSNMTGFTKLVLSLDDPAPTRHVDAPVGSPAGSLPPNQTVESNICSDCGRLIVGVFCKIKDKKLHEE